MSERDAWTARRRRVVRWLGREECPAEAVLEFYLGLLELQEPIFRHLVASGWNGDLSAPAGEHPSLLLDRLPVRELLPRFESFLGEVAPQATEVLSQVAAALTAGPELHGELLTTVLLQKDSTRLANQLSLEPLQLEFYPRAFLQPVAEALTARLTATAAQANGDDLAGWAAPRCPRCGWPPQVAVLRDEPEVKGHRYLVCSLCATWWTFPRSTCPACEESDAKKLLYHSTESYPHLRIEECQSCRTYLKAVDLRKDGHADPLVDDLASLELDLWAQEQRLTKLQRNVLGL